MPFFEKCGDDVRQLAESLMREFGEHRALIDCGVKIDFVFAYGDVDDNGERINDGLRRNGRRALGIARKIPLKDRTLGRGDAEIALDGDWWQAASDAEQRALLDHELHHLSVDRTKVDDLGRPIIKLRKHDFEFGWFTVIAERHGRNSIECFQARQMMDVAGQYYWPQVFDSAKMVIPETSIP